MTKSDINEVKLGGAKRKNGHKANCTCHICENMKKKAQRGGYEEEVEKEEEKKMGGSKKKNGHRANCQCPICKNMRNAKKGGADDDESSSSDEEMDTQQGGKKKKGNGHKPNCGCPICKNMRKSKKGGDEPDIENQKGDIEEGGIKPDNSATSDNETKASDDDYDALDAAEKGEAGPNLVGGRKSRKRHNSRSRKARRTRRRHRSRGRR